MVDGPDQYTNVHCPRGQAYDWSQYQNCFLTTEVDASKSFMLISRLDGKAVEGLDDGKVKFFDKDITKPEQKWIRTQIGDQFINVKTKKALETYSGKSWTFDGKMRVVSSRDSTIVMASTWSHDNGRDVLAPTKNEAWTDPTQTFMVVPFKNTKPELAETKFLIKSKLDGRVIQGKTNGDIEMQSETKGQNQLWIREKTDKGEEYINVGTRLPLVISDSHVWKFDESKSTIEDVNNPSKVLDRGWGQADGTNVGLWTTWAGVTQQFTFVKV